MRLLKYTKEQRWKLQAKQFAKTQVFPSALRYPLSSCVYIDAEINETMTTGNGTRGDAYADEMLIQAKDIKTLQDTFV